MKTILGTIRRDMDYHRSQESRVRVTIRITIGCIELFEEQKNVQKQEKENDKVGGIVARGDEQ